jgi:hypothetical protein
MPGQPGRFIDKDGEEFQITGAMETDRYDSAQIASGLIAVSHVLNFFQDKTNKNALDTNMPEASKLVTGAEQLYLERIGVSIEASNSTLIATSADYKRLMCGGFLEIRLNRDLLTEGPLAVYPSGYGLAGSTTDNAASVMNIGVPSATAVRPLLEQQIITSKHTVKASITFPARTWLSTSTMPTLDNQNVLRLYCHGILEFAATNN